MTIRLNKIGSFAALASCLFAVGCLSQAADSTRSGSDDPTGQAISALPDENVGPSKPWDRTRAVVQTNNPTASPAQIARMQAHLDHWFDPDALQHSFVAASGDKVDCVDILGQPAMKNPVLRGHALQMFPSKVPEHAQVSASVPEESYTMLKGDLDPNGNVRSCPLHTIPIRHLSIDAMKRFATLEDFLRKVQESIGQEGGGTAEHSLGVNGQHGLGPRALEQFAIAGQSVMNRGAEAILSVWSPYTEVETEFSSSALSVRRGTGARLQVVEAGIQHWRQRYGDDWSRLYIYSTQDGYRSRGCYNLDCGHFVQVSSTVYLGGRFVRNSMPGGIQRELKLLWYKDGPDGSWWLRYGDTWVGYYPRSLFDRSGLIDHSDSVQFGGEAINEQRLGLHSETDMGNGLLPSDGLGDAAYQRNILYVNGNNSYVDPSGLWTWRNGSRCYDIAVGYDAVNWRRFLSFGGPGYDLNCR